MHDQNQKDDRVDSAEDEIDLREIWRTLVAEKLLIIIVVAICTLLATTLSFLMTEKYQADVLVSMADDSKGGGGSSALLAQYSGLAEMAGLGAQSAGKESNIAYLKSRALIEAFINEKKLLPVLFQGKWDAVSGKWNVDDPEKIPSMWDAYQFFSKKVVTINADKKTGLVTISVVWKSREQAVEWANGLVAMANLNLRNRSVSDSQLSLDYLQKELQKTSVVEVQQAIYRVIETQVKSMMMANVQEQFAFKVIDPAALMDKDAYISPKRSLMIILGLLGGLFLGFVGVFVKKMYLSS